MTVDKLSDNSVKITLDKRDMKKYGICCFDPDPYSIRSVLSDTYEEMRERLGLTSDEQQVYAEVFSRPDRCLIFVSCESSDADKLYEKSLPIEILCEFESFDLLCDMCRSVFLIYPRFISESSLYCGDRIRLFLKFKGHCKGLIRLVRSCSNVIEANNINKAFTDEHYRLVIENNAVERILDYSS